MEMMYEERRAAVPRDMMALKATDDPILTRERRETMAKLTHKAFKGTVKVGLTCESLVNTIPSSARKYAHL
jgi:hypothetical protein